MSVDEMANVTWHTSLEEYFAATGERAQCLAWCHKRAEELYSHRRTFIDLPVIILSGLTGFCSVGSQNIFGRGNEQMSSIILGGTSLVVSVLNTVGSYFSWAKRAEGHRISSIQYSRLYRSLVVELNLPREERRTPAALLKDVKDQYDRLQEISPLLPPEIVNVFRKKFDSQVEISKPEETNGLENISIYPVDKRLVPTPSQTVQEHKTRLSSPTFRNIQLTRRPHVAVDIPDTSARSDSSASNESTLVGKTESGNTPHTV